ncbi:MAG: radical SAM protein, partial [Rhodospirillaceae bacterium]|nr:radical SAM protein [Rhodospirillaceae bacterium]
ACASLSQQWYAHAEREITQDDRRWMAALPRLIRFRLNGLRLAATHGAPSRINRFVFASTPAAETRAEIARANVDGIVGGHCGLPFIDRPGGKLWCNAGTVGMPANDGTTRGWYALLEPAPSGICVSLHPLVYQFGKAAAKMRRAGLAESYALGLETGLWPPVDFLPVAEQDATGREILPARALCALEDSAAAA